MSNRKARRTALRMAELSPNRGRGYSFGVNKTHGLRRSNEDKQAAVMHERGQGRTDSAIAEHCGVGTGLVRRCREDLEARHRIGAVTKRVGKDGKVYDTQKQATKNRATKTTTSKTTTTKQVVETPVEAEFVEEHEEPKTAYVLDDDTPTPEVVKDKLTPVLS